MDQQIKPNSLPIESSSIFFISKDLSSVNLMMQMLQYNSFHYPNKLRKLNLKALSNIAYIIIIAIRVFIEKRP